jgi:hypothetical protein
MVRSWTERRGVMKRVFAVLLLAVVSFVIMAAPAMAGSSTDAALALGAFAVFNQFVTGQTIFQHGFGPRPVIVQPPPTVIYAPPPPPPPAVIYAPPPVVYYAPPPPVVVYPNGYAYGAPGYYYRHHWKHHHEDDDD